MAEQAAQVAAQKVVEAEEAEAWAVAMKAVGHVAVVARVGAERVGATMAMETWEAAKLVAAAQEEVATVVAPTVAVA